MSTFANSEDPDVYNGLSKVNCIKLEEESISIQKVNSVKLFTKNNFHQTTRYFLHIPGTIWEHPIY